MTIVDYLSEFQIAFQIDFQNELKISNWKCYDMELPTSALAYQVLKNANISSEKQQLRVLKSDTSLWVWLTLGLAMTILQESSDLQQIIIKQESS